MADKVKLRKIANDEREAFVLDKISYDSSNNILSMYSSLDSTMREETPINISNVEVDTTLSQSGKAADAKVVGDRLANKVNVESGKSLSTNDYTNADKKKVDDIVITSPTNGQALVYNSSTQKWVNRTISGGGGSGQDGFSPTVAVTDITGGHRVAITDVNGTKTFDVMDGVDGGSSIVVDTTLSVEGAAAEAKAVGDKFNSIFTEKATDNLFDKDAVVTGSYINPYTGEIVAYNGVFHAFIGFEAGTYTFLGQHGIFGGNAYTVAIFDEDHKFVSYAEGTHTEIDSTNSIVTVTLSSQAASIGKYFGINGTSDILNTLMVVKGNQYPTEYIDYGTYKTIDGLQISKSQIIDLDGDTNPLSGKIVSFNGDSICAGAGFQGGYGKIIAEENGMTYENIGVGGGCVAYVDANTHCVSRTVANMRSDADYVILEGGGNDADAGVTLGTLSTGYDATLDDATFAGAFEAMLKAAIARFPGKKIGYVFIHKCSWQFDSRVPNSYYDVAKSACEKWGIPYCDLNTQIPPLNYISDLKTAYTANGDGYHPNEQGYKLFYVPKITAWLKTL